MMLKTIILCFIACSAYSAIPTADTVTNFAGMKFKRIPAGAFQMGFEGDSLKQAGAEYKLGVYNEYPRHSVTLTRDFYMGVHEVTNTQFKLFNPAFGSNIPWYAGGATVPVHKIRWAEADSFCRWLTEHDTNGWTYRLPTEAEWEYCCRAGTTTPYYTGDSITTADANACMAWGCNLTLKAVGSYAPNPWGLYDMIGNADEWCLDWYGPYPDWALTDPAGRTDGDMKAIRATSATSQNTISLRCAARSAGILGQPRPNAGLRVVISDNASLTYLPEKDTLLPYQRDVIQSLPAPGTPVSGEVYSDQDGYTFNRVRMGRAHYPQQLDSSVYVSTVPVSGDSGADRRLAGLHAQHLSLKYGVLYRISNRYELYNAGIANMDNGFHLTILPDLKYENGRLHPDVANSRATSLKGFRPQPAGPLYDWNILGAVTEAPNGDLLTMMVTDNGENGPFSSGLVARLRNGAAAWDSTCPFYDVPLIENSGFGMYNNGKGRLFVFDGCSIGPFYRTSDDNGVTWSRPQAILAAEYLAGSLPFVATAFCGMGGADTFVQVNTQRFAMSSFDGGLTWNMAPGSYNGIEAACCLLDDRKILLFARAGNDSICMLQQTSANLGTTWTSKQSPFFPFGCCGNHPAMLKLQSGRVILATSHLVSNGVNVLGESVDQGDTWFARKIQLSQNSGYRQMLQTRDGIIHLMGEGDRVTGAFPMLSFSEQWLREAPCLDVAQWGVNVAGTLTDCSDPANTEPVWFDSVPPAASPDDKRRGVSQYAPTLVASPNPFNPSVRISVSGAESGAWLTVYGINGRVAARLPLKLGIAEWNATGKASGVYLVEFKEGKRILRTRVSLVR